MGGGGYAGGWYLYGSEPYGRLPELEGISGSVFIGWYSYRGSYRIAAHTDTHAAAATPPSLSAEHVERSNQVKHGKANPEAVTESNVQTA